MNTKFSEVRWPKIPLFSIEICASSTKIAKSVLRILQSNTYTNEMQAKKDNEWAMILISADWNAYGTYVMWKAQYCFNSLHREKHRRVHSRWRAFYRLPIPSVSWLESDIMWMVKFHLSESIF